MAKYLTDDTDLTAVADAIRAKGGSAAKLSFPEGFVKTVQDLPGAEDRPNLLGVAGLQWFPGYLNASGNLQNPSATNQEMTSDFAALPRDATGQLLFTLELPAANAASCWGAYIVYDAGKNILGSRRQFAFIEGVSGNGRKLMCSLSDHGESRAAFIRVSFRSFGSARVCLETVPSLQEDMADKGVPVPEAST